MFFPVVLTSVGGAKTFLGSVMDERFDLKLRTSEFAGCRVKRGCICKEDYLHLQIARSSRQECRSLGVGYPGVVSDAEKQKMQKVLQNVQKTGLVRVLNAMVG